MDYLYHYTSLETLALILNNRTICFNNLMNVDDPEEAETGDMGQFGKYMYVSCWTSEEEESIPMWGMYTGDMMGVRIRMPVNPFKQYHFQKGELYLENDVNTFIDLRQIYEDNKISITADQPKLIEVKYTNDENKIFPQVRFCSQEGDVESYLNCREMNDLEGMKEVIYSFENLGRYKRENWKFQKEWRYTITCSPMGMKELSPPTLKKQQELIRRLEDRERKAAYNRIFLEIDEVAFNKMEILFGPKMNEGQKILAKAILEKYGLGHAWKESELRIR